ncbi:hypothetical protein ACHHYP_07992 [Achlya hypogyna]|uniref:Acyl-CoA oxidase C-alpha1 domain-containing protein n=1 Tax=Achlya hypogyna TaxID=1202772 RepID=A0A1V9YQ68_ACHHY|nr:hypothetical protein ACHHYP_07992 [Achlya hypogyna]
MLAYENQQRTLFPLIAMSYDHLELLQQLHATSSWLKVLVTREVSDDMERARRARGDHGYSASSNIPHLIDEFVGSACTGRRKPPPMR